MILFETFTCKDGVPSISLGGCFNETQKFAPHSCKNAYRVAGHYLAKTSPFINGLENDYCNFETWISQKVYFGLLSGNRELVFVREGNRSAGLAILKNSHDEKKICTLIISKKFQKAGIGSLLLDHCIQALGSQQQMITVTDRREGTLGPLLKTRKFNQTEMLTNYYKRNSVEYVFVRK